MNRYKSALITSILGIIANIFLLVIKFIISIFTNSYAMIADAFNSAGDILVSFITFIGNKIASKPSDDDHNLGHGKAEYIYSMIISIILLLGALVVLKSAITSLFISSVFNYSPWLIVVCFITIFIKFFLYLYTRKISKKHNNLLIEANSKDHLNDVFITTGNLIASLCASFGVFWIDSLVGLLICGWLIYTSTKIFKESYDVLMDKSISEETKNEVYEIIKKHQEIIKINHFNSTPVGYKYQISFTIFVDGNLSTFESHEIADKLEKEIIEKIDEIYLVVIHVNPS